MNKVMILSMVLILLGCGAGVSDFTQDLGNGYVFESFGQDLKNIRTPVPGQKDIYGKVVQYVYDKNDILVIQQPNKKIYRNILGEEIISKNRSKYPNHSIDDIREGQRIADSLIMYDPYYRKIFAHKINYWIISHKNKQIYGPLTEEEYYHKRKDLNVSRELQFDNDEKQ